MNPAIDELEQILNGKTYKSAIDELQSLLKEADPYVLNPEDGLFLGVAISSRDYMLKEGGKLPAIPDPVSVEQRKQVSEQAFKPVITEETQQQEYSVIESYQQEQIMQSEQGMQVPNPLMAQTRAPDMETQSQFNYGFNEDFQRALGVNIDLGTLPNYTKTFEQNQRQEKIHRYERVRQAFSMESPISNIDAVATDFSLLDPVQQDEILKSIVNEDKKRTLATMTGMVEAEMLNLDLTKEENRAKVKKMISSGYDYANKQWSLEDVLQLGYKDVSANYLSAQGYEFDERYGMINKIPEIAKRDLILLGLNIAMTVPAVGLSARLVAGLPAIARTIAMVASNPRTLFTLKTGAKVAKFAGKLGAGYAGGAIVGNEASDFLYKVGEGKISDEDLKFWSRYIKDFAIGLGIGGVFGKSIMKSTNMSLWKYATSLVATEAVMTGASEKLLDEYGLKGLAPLVPLAIILSPEMLVGTARWLARGARPIISKGVYSIRDMVAISAKTSKGFEQNLNDITNIGVKVTDDIADETNKNIGRNIASMIEIPTRGATKTALATIESNIDEYNALKLPLNKVTRPAIDPDTLKEVYRVKAVVNDDSSVRIDYFVNERKLDDLLAEDFINRAIQSGNPVVDMRYYNEAKNLVNYNTISDGVKDVTEKVTYEQAVLRIKSLRNLDGVQREQTLRQVLDDIINETYELNNYTDKVISEVNLGNAFDDLMNAKGDIKKFTDSLTSVGLNPFYGTKMDEIMRKDAGYIDAMQKLINRKLNLLNNTILKGLSKEERTILDEIMATGTDIQKSFKSVEDIAKFDADLASKVNEKVFRAYKDLRLEFDYLGEALAKETADRHIKAGLKMYYPEGTNKYYLVKPLEEFTDETGKKVKILNMESGKELIIDPAKLQDIDYRKYLLEGYAPRVQKGNINITVFDGNGNKIDEYRGFENPHDAGVFAKNLENSLDPNSKIVIHNFHRNPIPSASKQHLLKDIEEYSMLDSTDELVDLFRQNEASPEHIRQFLKTLGADDIVKLRNTIEFNRIQKISTRFMRERKVKPVGVYSKEDLEQYRKEIERFITKRLEIDKALKKYTNAFVSSFGIDRYRETLRQQFVKKFGHVMSFDEVGNPDWRSFDWKKLTANLDAPEIVMYKNIQRQIERMYRMPTKAEILADKGIESVKQYWYKNETRVSRPDITKRLMLSSDFAEQFNDKLTSLAGNLILFFEPFHLILQSFQSIPTLMANPDVAIEALAKSMVSITKTGLRKIPALRDLKILQDMDMDIIRRSGVYENVLLDENLAKSVFSKYSTMPMVWGELAQRTVAGHVALAKARQLGIKEGQDLTKFVYDTATKYALDMSNYSKRALSEGFTKWNVGLFSRYFTQTAELFWKGLPADKKLASGLALYEMFGAGGIPFGGDVRNLYNNNRHHLINMMANIGLMIHSFERHAIENMSPEELIDNMYGGDIDPERRYELIAEVKKDKDFYKSLLRDYEKENLEEILAKSKGYIDFIDKVMNKNGTLSSLSGRLAFNDFFSQKMKKDTFTTPFELVGAVLQTGGSAIRMVTQGILARTLGLNVAPEDRTPFVKELYDTTMKNLGNLSPNAYDFVQGIVTLANLGREDWDNLNILAGHEYITTPKGTPIKRMDEADLHDVVKVLSGYGYRDIFDTEQAQFKATQLAQILIEQTKKEAKEVGDLLVRGETKKAYERMFFYEMRNKVYYGDSLSAKLYNNTFKKEYSKYVEEFRDPLREQYSNPLKMKEIEDLYKATHGVDLPDHVWDDTEQ